VIRLKRDISTLPLYVRLLKYIVKVMHSNIFLLLTSIIMAVNQSSSWDDFLGVRSENQSYLTYFLSLKFIWAPLKRVLSFVANRIFELLNANNNHVQIIPLDENPAFAPVKQQTIMTAADMIDSYRTQK